MSRKTIGYEDAVELLGGECKIVKHLSNLTGAALIGLAAGGVPAAVGFFELKDEIFHLSQSAIKTLRRRLTGVSRFKRSELIEAAHAILVVSAFFAALDDLDEELGTALNTASLDLVKSEQVALAANSECGIVGFVDLVRELIAPGQIPGLEAGIVNHGRKLDDYYLVLASKVYRFAQGTAVWDSRNDTVYSRWGSAIVEILPKRAYTRYEEQLALLAGEFPEFAFWANRVGAQEILSELSAAKKVASNLDMTLRNITNLLAATASGANPGKIRGELIARYRDQIAKPVAGVAIGTVSDGVKPPPLQDLYVTPSYRMIPLGSGGIERVTETGWADAPRRPDLVAMVLQHLISSHATHVPLVLLGQPGAGKSVFTQMLAAQLDPRDYLVVRVELRAVPSDASIQEQIEAALTGLTGRVVKWPELAESAGNAQPVILLDGFDELLQASGVSHFDFLHHVQEFQEREAELDRPIVVLVTSRTAVANQVRYPAGTPVARLEEFDDDQAKQWLSVWNKANPGRPLAAQTALAQGELARQPLLLFLLALFHSGGGNLTPGISQANLFERLFTSFVERDVDKLDSQLTERQRQHAVQRDLDSLSMVAFAMFNRGRQSVSETHLIADLTALQPEHDRLADQSRRAVALTIAERMAGRFFFRLFVHRDEALRGQQTVLSTYEFLHASFGEFLVGRWIVNEIGRLSEQCRRSADDPYPSPPDDSKLHALLSITAISTREQRILDFIQTLLDEKLTDDLVDYRTLVRALFRTSLHPRTHNPYAGYQPSLQSAPAAYAAYSANLALLMLLVSHAESVKLGELRRAKVPVAELRTPGNVAPTAGATLAEFYSVTRLWHSQLTNSEWNSLLDVIKLQASGASDEKASDQAAAYEISMWDRKDVTDTHSGYGILQNGSRSTLYDYHVAHGGLEDRAFREATLLGASGYRGACTALLPYLASVDSSISANVFEDGRMAALSLAPLIPTSRIFGARRANLYKGLFEDAPGGLVVRLFLDRFRDDMRNLSKSEITRAALAAAPYAWMHITAYLDIVAQINDMTNGIKLRRPTRELSKLLEPLDVFERSGIPIFRLPETGGELPSEVEEGPEGKANPVSLVYRLSGRDLVALLDPRDVVREEDVTPLFDMLGITEPGDVLVLLGLRDFLGLSKVRALRKLSDKPLPSRGERNRRSLSWCTSPILRITLWAGMKWRGLPTFDLPSSLSEGDAERLQIVAPDFVARIRRLAAEHGVHLLPDDV